MAKSKQQQSQQSVQSEPQSELEAAEQHVMGSNNPGAHPTDEEFQKAEIEKMEQETKERLPALAKQAVEELQERSASKEDEWKRTVEFTKSKALWRHEIKQGDEVTYLVPSTRPADECQQVVGKGNVVHKGVGVVGIQRADRAVLFDIPIDDVLTIHR